MKKHKHCHSDHPQIIRTSMRAELEANSSIGRKNQCKIDGNKLDEKQQQKISSRKERNYNQQTQENHKGSISHSTKRTKSKKSNSSISKTKKYIENQKQSIKKIPTKKIIPKQFHSQQIQKQNSSGRICKIKYKKVIKDSSQIFLKNQQTNFDSQPIYKALLQENCFKITNQSVGTSKRRGPLILQLTSSNDQKQESLGLEKIQLKNRVNQLRKEFGQVQEKQAQHLIQQRRDLQKMDNLLQTDLKKILHQKGELNKGNQDLRRKSNKQHILISKIVEQKQNLIDKLQIQRLEKQQLLKRKEASNQKIASLEHQLFHFGSCLKDFQFMNAQYQQKLNILEEQKLKIKTTALELTNMVKQQTLFSQDVISLK